MSTVSQLSRDLGVSTSLEMMERVGIEGEDTLIVALNYRCNNRCRYCMIAPEIEQSLPDGEDRLLQEVFRWNLEHRAFQRLVVSGAEATLLPDLPKVVAAAIQRGGFERVRIQTNARRLRDATYARALFEAGLTEYFVSVNAPDAALDTHITRSPRSFREMQQGVANLKELGARVISNTVVCRANHLALPGVADLLLDMDVVESEFWSFVELGDAGQSDQLVPVGDVMPPLLQALDSLTQAGSGLGVKWFPRCLLGRHAALLDNHQPQMLIRDAFQQRLANCFSFSCPHRQVCAHHPDPCQGLHERYIAVLGDERDLLQPTARSEGPGGETP